MTMRKIEAFIKPFKLNEVKDALMEVGVHGMTVTEARDLAHPIGRAGLNLGAPYAPEYPKLKIEIVLAAEHVGATVEAISKSARTGTISDGKIFVSKVDNVIRTRTGECGEAAILIDELVGTCHP